MSNSTLGYFINGYYSWINFWDRRSQVYHHSLIYWLDHIIPHIRRAESKLAFSLTFDVLSRLVPTTPTYFSFFFFFNSKDIGLEAWYVVRSSLVLSSSWRRQSQETDNSWYHLSTYKMLTKSEPSSIRSPKKVDSTSNIPTVSYYHYGRLKSRIRKLSYSLLLDTKIL